MNCDAFCLLKLTKDAGAFGVRLNFQNLGATQHIAGFNIKAIEFSP
jgi:hypothetical protein